MKFKRLAVAAALGSATFSGAALAELSGNVGVVSEYLFRGFEQSFGSAVQGGLDYESASGFYAGTWASNIASGFAGGVEVDFYAGFAGEAGSVGYDLGVIYYWYPEEKEDPGSEKSNGGKTANTVELYGALEFGPVSVSGYYAPSNYFATDESAYGIGLGFSAPVSDKLSFDAFIGHNGGKGNEALTPDGDTYIDYSVGVSAEIDGGFSFGLAFVGTDISDDDPKLVVSGGLSFGL